MNGRAGVVHEVRVSRKAGLRGSAFHQAACTCGWEGFRWIGRALAVEDAKDHLTDCAS